MCIHPRDRNYVADKTKIKLREEAYIEMNIENGIRQGCTASTVFFKLITYKIIEELEKKCKGVMYGHKEIMCLFFADDGILISDNVNDARQQILILNEVIGKYGLMINKKKSKCMIYNMKDKPEEIEEIEVVNSIKYLGVFIQDSMDIFGKQREKLIGQAKKLGNFSYSIIMKSCHKVLIGKTYWKIIALPSILYGAELVTLSMKDIEKMQRVENGVLRVILNAPSYACIAGMQGEIGISTMRSRIARMKIQYVRMIKQGNKLILKDMWSNMLTRNNKFSKDIQKYLSWAEIEDVKMRIAKVVEKEWREEIIKKSTLKIYRENKLKMQQVNHYTNHPSSAIWFRAKTNCMMLNDRNRFKKTNNEVECKLCGGEKEDLLHFILECGTLNEERIKSIVLQRPWNEEREKILGIFLFHDEEIGRKKEILYNMWLKRKRILKHMAEVGSLMDK